LDDDRHHAGLANKTTFGIAPKNRGRQSGGKSVDLPARIAQSRELDQGLSA
jgi:hypothetical protein